MFSDIHRRPSYREGEVVWGGTMSYRILEVVYDRGSVGIGSGIGAGQSQSMRTHKWYYKSYGGTSQPWPFISGEWPHFSQRHKGFPPLFSLMVWDGFVCAGLLVVPAFYLRSRYRSRQRYQREKENLCACCGYDLRASNDRCPECGTPITAPIPAASGA